MLMARQLFVADGLIAYRLWLCDPSACTEYSTTYLSCTWCFFLIFSDDELNDLPEESLLYSPEKTEQKSGVCDDRPKNEIVSTACL